MGPPLNGEPWCEAERPEDDRARLTPAWLKDRAEALGGHLRLHSPAGTGTTLDITLPLQASGPDPLP